jgi:hypothetical protein
MNHLPSPVKATGMILVKVSRQKEKRTLPRAMATVSRFNYVTVSYPNPGSGRE